MLRTSFKSLDSLIDLILVVLFFEILNSEKDSELLDILQSKPNHICKVCKNGTYKAPSDVHIKIMRLLFPQLTDDIYSKIWSYLIYPKGHLIHFTVKSRSCPSHMVQDDEDDRFGYYWEEAHHICTKCFKSSLYDFVLKNRRLPELRNEARLILQAIPSTDVDWVWTNKLILPDIYYIKQNRNNHIKKDGFVLIPSK